MQKESLPQAATLQVSPAHRSVRTHLAGMLRRLARRRLGAAAAGSVGGGTSYSTFPRAHPQHESRRRSGEEREYASSSSLAAVAAFTAGARRRRRSRYGGVGDVPWTLIRRRDERARYLLVLDGVAFAGLADQRQTSVWARTADWSPAGVDGWWMVVDWARQKQVSRRLGRSHFLIARSNAGLSRHRWAKRA